jgi:hypothetical protein
MTCFGPTTRYVSCRSLDEQLNKRYSRELAGQSVRERSATLRFHRSQICLRVSPLLDHSGHSFSTVACPKNAVWFRNRIGNSADLGCVKAWVQAMPYKQRSDDRPELFRVRANRTCMHASHVRWLLASGSLYRASSRNAYRPDASVHRRMGHRDRRMGFCYCRVCQVFQSNLHRTRPFLWFYE